MFKNVKKVLFALVLAFVGAFAFACGGSNDDVKEANKENCKEFCDSCPTCDTCNNASAETCKDFCPAAPECKEASAETCKKFQDFVAPTAFYVDGDTVVVGKTKEVYVDEDAWEPEGCDTTLVFVSQDPLIATVSANGVVTGVRPGKVQIYVYSPLNPEVQDTVEFEVKDAETNDQKVVDRELAKIVSELPNFVAETTDLPTPWNTSVEVTYKAGANAVTKLEVPADLAADTQVSLSITCTLGEASASYSAKVWLVKDANVNTFVVIDSAAALLENYLAPYVAGEKVASDLTLLDNLFGCSIKWSSSLATALDIDGKYTAPDDDKAVTLDALLKYGEGSRNVSFQVVVKGFSAEEKADYIMAHTFGKMEGKEFNTSIVLPDFDDTFGAKLSYTSQDTAVYDNSGKLVAAVTEAKNVKFTVKIEYTIGATDAQNFTAEKELTIKAVPANAASTYLETALATDAFKQYQKVVHAPWGKTAGNILFPALEGMKWDVEAVKLDARLQDDYQVFSQTAAGLKLEAQYLRYQLVSIKGTFEKDSTKTDIVLFFNIGVSETPLNIISAIWRSSAQKDQTLSPEQGKYDLAGNVSYFDKKIGYVTETYGSGYFSGWSVSATVAASKELSISKAKNTEYPEWKCAVAEVASPDYTGINKLLVTVKGTQGEQILFKVNDQSAGEQWVTATGETQELSFDLSLTFDTTKYPLVVFCNPNADGSGNPFVISKCQLVGDSKVIDLLDASWRGLDAGVYTITKPEAKIWQTFMMEVLTVYIREDASGVYIDPANVNGGIAGAGGNWGVWYVNTTDKEVNIEVGVYGDASLKYAEGHETSSAIGSRLNIAMDGYALGFVADKDGKIIHGSNNSKLQNGMQDRRAYLGGKTYKVGEKVSVAMYNAMQLEGKENKFEAVYTAADNLLFVQANTGTFKKVVDGETTSYVAIKEGEEVAEADRFAPTYAKGAALTAEQYTALDADTKALVTVEYKAKEAVTYVVPNLFGDSANGAVVNYLTIPANGYAMSWKYQFYGVGNPATVYPFCQTGDTLKIEHYQVHPLSSMDAEYATNYVVAAEDLLKEAEINHVSFEANVNAARARYAKLSGDTLADVFPAERLTALEAKAAEFLDADITALLASEPAEGADRAEFAQGLATMWSRLYKTENNAVVNKLSDEITNALTKKADFDAKYAEYAAIDLTITYDYNGGYIQGFWKDTDKAEFLVLFKTDLYNFMVEKGAWANATAPTLEEFISVEYWTENYAKYADTLLGEYLFTPKVDGETVNENYHDIIEGSNKFFNSPEGHDYIALMDYVDESTRSGNMGGQDAWGRKGEQYAAMEWLQKQSYYSTLSEAEQTKDLTTYGGNPVMVTNSGTLLGAYRFAQWVCGTGSASYKNWIPNNVWSNVFDRQYTQEHNTQIYHCTDLTVKLQDEPYKKGYTFLGWKFEDGTDAVITGSMFKDVTVYAAWVAGVEEAVEKDLNLTLEGVYYGQTANTNYGAATTPGTIVDQTEMTGLGSYAFIVGNKFFLLGKFAGIELGKDATADVTLDTKDSVQPYGQDGSTQFSCGLKTIDGAVKVQNSYGYGALYHNASDQFKVTITEVKNTYGRNLMGENYGYERFLFHYNEEKKLYVGTKVSSADGTSVTLEPGDFLWCPMTAERFCTGLTNCNGANGVEGIWNGVEAPEALIVDVSKYVPADSPAWYTVEFIGNDGKVAKTFYPEAGQTTTFKTLDYVKNILVKDGKAYKLLGWATTADATEAAIAKDVTELQATADATYYPVYAEVEAQDVVTLNTPIEALGGDSIDNLADAMGLVKAGGTIIVPAGTYKTGATINKSVTILGPNADTVGYAAHRAPEALVSGQLTVAADNVTIKGLNIAGGSAKIAMQTVSNVLIENNLFNGGSPTNVIHADFGYDVTDLTITGNAFVWAKRSYGFRPIRVSKLVTNFEFSNNYVSNDHADAATLIDYFYIENAAGTFKINDNNFACIPSTNWLTNIRNMSGVTALEYKNNYAAGQAGTNNASGINFMLSAMPATSTVAIEGNTFANMSGTIINLGAPAAAIPVSIKGNVYTDNVEFRCRNRGSVVITYADNAYYKAPEASDANPAPSDYTRLAVLTVNPAAEEDATHFKTIAAALTAAKANETIVIAAGTYSEALTIDKSVTLKGPNAGKLGTATDRADEAILAGTITVSADNVKIDGFKLTAQVTFPASATVANFEYVNNLLADFAGEGFVNAVSSTLVNVNISGNYTPDCKSVRWIRLGTVENMKCNDNKIVGSNLYDTFRVDTCLFGYCEFMGNHVESTLQSVFMIMGVGKMTLVVKDNYFKDILATCVDTRGMVAAHAGDVVEFVIHNTFDHAGYDWRCLRPRNASFGDNKLDVQVHYNSFINGCATEVEGVKTYANNPAGADVIYNMNYNFFQEVKAAELTNANFAGVASSWAEGFDSAEALEAAYAKVK